MKYCLVHVMYCTRSSGVASSGTRINEGAAVHSDKVAGTMHPVSQSYRDVTRG